MTEPNIEKKEAPDRGSVDVIGASYEPGKPEGEDQGRWESKLLTRNEKLKYIKDSMRYWYAKEGFGSEKRKTPA